MHLQSIASAAPEASYSQADCLEIIRNAPAAVRLKPRSLKLLEQVLSGDSGIEKRHFAVEDIETVFDKSAEEQSQDFERLAPALAEAALTPALEKAGIAATDLDALFICTCTGYLCPGVSSYLAERVGMRSDALLQDIVGLGCGAAIPTLRTAAGYLALHPNATVAVVAVEVCSSAFYVSDDPGVLISLCLFGDGASASIWSGKNRAGQPGLSQFQSLHLPEHREKIRFVNREGHLCNQLHRSVPSVSADAVAQLYQARPESAPIPLVVTHNGGRDVLDAIRTHLPDAPLLESTEALKQFGNVSSPSVLIALEKALATSTDDPIWLCGFGAGFSCHSAELVPSTDL